MFFIFADLSPFFASNQNKPTKGSSKLLEFMKKIEGTIYVECDLCWKTTTWYRSCYICGHTVCIMCLLQENFCCPVCGGDFIKPIPKTEST